MDRGWTCLPKPRRRQEPLSPSQLFITYKIARSVITRFYEIIKT